MSELCFCFIRDYADRSFIANICGVLRFYLVSYRPKGSFVTGSKENSYNHTRDLSLYQKLFRDLWENGIAYSIFLLLATIFSLLYSFTAAIRAENFLMHALTTIAWPHLAHICFLVLKNLSVPVTYMLDPPKYPERATPSTGLNESQTETKKSSMQCEAMQATWKGISKVSKDIMHSGKRLEINEEAMI